MFSASSAIPTSTPDSGAASLAEFLAVRLLFERRAVEPRLQGNWAVGRDWARCRTRRRGAAHVRQLDAARAVAAGAGRRTAAAVGRGGRRSTRSARLWTRVARLHASTRRQVFHDAYERTYRRVMLDALAARRALAERPRAKRPRAQFVFCIDEREESIRRALEEQHPAT